MSFTTNKTNEDLPQSALSLQLSRKSASAPAFKPQIVRSLRMHPVLAAIVAAIVLVCLVGFALFQKSVYLAISQVYEEPAAPKLLSDPSAAIFDANKYDTFLGEQIQLVQRLDVLTAALNTLPPTTYREFGSTPAQAAEAIQTQIKVVRVATSYQVSISLKGNDPQKVADIVNAITTSYIGAVQKANSAEYDQRAQLLGEERQRTESELQTARSEQTALGASIGVANPAGGDSNPYDAELSGIRSQLVEARAAHDVAAAQLGSLSGVGQTRTDGLIAAADELIAGDAGLGSMKATISQRKAQLNEQMSGMTPSNPIYRQDQDQIADLDRTLDRMTNELRDKAARRLQDKLRTDLQRTGDIESRLNAQLARQIANATSAAPRLQRATEVAADIQRLDTRMAAVDDALRSLRLEVSGPAQVRLSLPATPPERPEANRRMQLLLLALPLALICGLAAAVFARKQNKRIYGGVDIDEVLGFPPLAVLPARADVSQRVFEEYVLRLAAGIESAYRTSGARTFLLTAVSLTTDIRPLALALTRKFEEIGVNVIVATASDMLAPTDGMPSRSSEPMTSGELARVVELWSEGFVAANVAKMKSEHGLVLIESEALLNCAQTEYVARCADATILIVECGVTTRPELFRAAELLHRLNVTGIGAVLEEIQLRYADSDFRKAIDALDRRQAEAARQDRRTRVQVAPVEVAPSHEDVAPKSETLMDETAVEPLPIPESAPKPTPPAEAISEKVVHEIPEASPRDVTLLEVEGDRVKLEYEPAHYHEVLHHVRAARPFDDDSSWQLPVFSQVPVQPGSEAAAGWPTASSLGSELVEAVAASSLPVFKSEEHAAVENPSQTGQGNPENTLAPSDFDASNEVSHEKISPRLSARRDQPLSDGDPGMERSTSWIGRLLRFDSAPVVSIIPAGDDDDTGEVLSAEARVRTTSPVPTEAQTAAADYDVSLASRLKQISGGWPVAQPSAPTTDIAAFKESQRAPSVPVQDEVASVPPVHLEKPIEVALPEPTPTAEAVPKVRRGPAAWATVDESVEEVSAQLADMPSQPGAEAAPIAELRRRLTFQEMIDRTARQVAAPPAESAPAPVAHVPVPQTSVHEVQPPVELKPLPILGHVSEYIPAVPTVETFPIVDTVAPEPFVPSHIEEAPEPALTVAEPTVEGQIHEIADAHDFENVPKPTYHFSPPAPLEQSWESIPDPIAAEAPEFHFSDRYVEEPKRHREPTPAYDPYRPSPYDFDDIEPVYHEASRSLNTGRWDPIPPLRPSTDGWRDRPSPVPVNGRDAGRSANGIPRDGFNQFAPQRWIPEESYPVEPEPEQLSEPMLSRQWGLLSKFQQSRLGSSPQTATSGEGSGDLNRDDDRPAKNYRDHRS